LILQGKRAVSYPKEAALFLFLIPLFLSPHHNGRALVCRITDVYTILIFQNNIFWHFIQNTDKIPKTNVFWGLKSIIDIPSA
jgi:hypothetical protein